MINLQSALLSLLFASQLRLCRPTEEKPLSPDAWKGICDVAAAIRSKLDKAEHALAAKARVAHDAALKNARTQLLLAKAATNEERRKLQPVSAMMNERLASANAALAEAEVNKITAATKHGAYFLGHINEYFTVAATAVQTSTKGCLTQTHDGTEFKTYTEIKRSYTNCKAATLSETAAWDSKPGESQAGYKKLNSGGTNVGSSAKGCRLHTLETNSGLLGGTPTQTTAHLAAGLLTISQATPDLKDLTALAAKASQDGYKIVSAVYAATKDDTNTPTIPDYPTKGDAKNSPAFVKTLIQAFSLSEDLKEPQLSKEVDSIYGTEADAIKRNIWNQLDTIKTEKVYGDTPAGTKASQITDVRLLLELAENASAAATAAAIEEEKKHADNPHTCKQSYVSEETSKHCNTIGDDKAKCNGEKQCSYDDSKEAGKKCTYNASKAKENNVPVAQTQTGGSAGTNDKCKDKKKDECKSPDCKWEGETCKDSSFLFNKKLAEYCRCRCGISILRNS
ncbi:Trypanosome variant surface glycoprotein (A-type) [Trypanosoma brucei equiperdum]|uniref:Trypanosome variant surface glycoprotein (A-type) n=1 Tax=Trypanosoma brucei equiperdum TaxID=630700 RepID=A0A3L6L7W0_9TRYP|nr:Trypanosome variant surface glycoprotein (A-type) [Trypanosoma brucei equiperdum]